MKLLQVFAIASIVMLPLSLVYAESTAKATTSAKTTQVSKAQPKLNDADQFSPININKADAKTLSTLPGIGGKKGQDIVAYRDSHGAFQQRSDLEAVKGISPAMVDKLGKKITVG